MFIDTHIHTRDFSSDAQMSGDELIAYASANQPCILYTTEHFDYDYPYSKFQLCCDLDQYHKAYQASKAQYEAFAQKPYPILFGVEYGYMEHLGSYYNNLSKQYPFDSIICSVHYFDQCDPYFEFDRTLYQKGKKFAYGRYLETVVHQLEHCSDFDIVGHYDYVTRYAPYSDKKMYYRDFPDLFDSIFTLCIQNGKALEFNTRTSSRLQAEGMSDFLFDPDILVRYKELGGELLSLGSDAHGKESIGVLFEETKELFKRAGFDHLVYYQKRKPSFLPI